MSGILICGAGNKVYADDGIGPASMDDIRSEVKLSGLQFLNLGSSPHDLKEKVAEMKPSHIVIISSLDMKRGPGHIEILDSRKSKKLLRDDGQTDLEMFIVYIQRIIDVRIDLIGVQPWSRKQHKTLSPEARNAMTVIKQTVKELLGL